MFPPHPRPTKILNFIIPHPTVYVVIQVIPIKTKQPVFSYGPSVQQFASDLSVEGSQVCIPCTWKTRSRNGLHSWQLALKRYYKLTVKICFLVPMFISAWTKICTVEPITRPVFMDKGPNYIFCYWVSETRSWRSTKKYLAVTNFLEPQRCLPRVWIGESFWRLVHQFIIRYVCPNRKRHEISHLPQGYLSVFWRLRMSSGARIIEVPVFFCRLQTPSWISPLWRWALSILSDAMSLLRWHTWLLEPADVRDATS